MSAYQKLSDLFAKNAHLGHLQAITSWDEAVMMPVGGGHARADALATLQGIMHENLVNPQIAEWLVAAREDPSLAGFELANLCWMEKKYVDATLVPKDLVQAQVKAAIECEQFWRHARADNNWTEFAPYLQTIFQLVKETAELKAEHWEVSAYDVLLNDFVPGFNQASIDPIFKQLAETLPQLITQITAKQQADNTVPCKGPFSIEKQRQLGLTVMQRLGFDFNHGRLDVSHHPFCGGVADDVRITTRYDENDFMSALMGVCHETGHGRYEQGLPAAWRYQPVGEALGMAVHESQSLLVEMQICRSAEFLEYLLPLLIAQFGEQAAFTQDNLYKLYTRVQPSLIRVDADEVTYPLHVIMRYQIEQQLFTGDLTIKDLPDAWHSYMQQYFGLSTQDDYTNGVMQDVHWPSGGFGYFPSYTLGRLIASQLYVQVLKEHPELPGQIKQGEFATIFDWLNKHVHARASSVSCEQLLLDATGEGLNAVHFMQHIEQKYKV